MPGAKPSTSSIRFGRLLRAQLSYWAAARIDRSPTLDNQINREGCLVLGQFELFADFDAWREATQV